MYEVRRTCCHQWTLKGVGLGLNPGDAPTSDGVPSRPLSCGVDP